MVLESISGAGGPTLIRTWLSVPHSALTVRIADWVLWGSVPLAAFKERLQHVLTTHFHRNQTAMATALGMDVRSLRRTLSPEGHYPFNVLHCLRLAAIARLDPSIVLREADHDEEADLIEALYGRAALSASDEELLAAWRDCGRLLGPDVQTAFLRLLTAPLQVRTAQTTPHPAPSRPPRRRPRKR